MNAATKHPLTMRAVVHDRYGSPDVLVLRDVPRPAVGAEDVLVRVRAASVNYADWTILRGSPSVMRLAFGLSRPRNGIRGRDVAGIVEAVGDRVTEFRPGDAVYGEVAGGTFAEYTVAPQALLAPMPANLTFDEASTVPLAGGTALQAVELAGVRSGQRVLVNGASGGVGLFAVQLAKVRGTHVTAVCAARNLDQARALGADEVIDYRATDFTRSGLRFDVILDFVGNHGLRSLRGALEPDGVLVLSSGGGGRVLGPLPRIAAAVVTSPFVSQHFRPLAAVQSKQGLLALTALIEASSVVPVIERRYPLIETADALRRFGEHHARSKIVIQMEES